MRRAVDRILVQTELERPANSSALVANGLYFSASTMVGLQARAAILGVSPTRHSSDISSEWVVREERLDMANPQVGTRPEAAALLRLKKFQAQESVGGARSRRDSNRRLQSVTKFARGIEPVAGLGCNRYFDPEKSPTGNFGGVATLSVCGGNLQFKVFPDPPKALGNEDRAANEKAPRPSLTRTPRGSSRQATLTIRSGMSSPFTSRVAIRSPPEGPTKWMDCWLVALSWNSTL